MIKIINETRYDNIFNPHKADGSVYTELIPGNEENDYYLKYKNLKGEIVYMTPREYYNNCIKYCFPNTTFDALVQSRSIEKENNDYIAQKMEQENNLNMPYIDITKRGQEGLHRMYVCAQKYGWDENEFPVLVIDYADKEKQKTIDADKEKNDILKQIMAVIDNCLEYTYKYATDVAGQLDWEIDKIKDDYDIDLAYESFVGDNDEERIRVYSVKYPNDCFGEFGFNDVKVNPDMNDDIDDYDWADDLSEEELDKLLGEL